MLMLHLTALCLGHQAWDGRCCLPDFHALCTLHLLDVPQAMSRDNNYSINPLDDIGFLPYDTISSFMWLFWMTWGVCKVLGWQWVCLRTLLYEVIYNNSTTWSWGAPARRAGYRCTQISPSMTVAINVSSVFLFFGFAMYLKEVWNPCVG